MLSNLRSRPTFANVVSLVALFVALGLGTAWAVERNSIKSKHIVNGQVKGPDIADNGVTGADVDESTLDVVESTLGKVLAAADADTLGGSPPSAFLPSDRVTQIMFNGGPCGQPNDGGCTAQFLGPDPAFMLTATCEQNGANPRLRVRVDLVSDAGRTVNFNGISGSTASQGGFGALGGDVVLIELDQKAVVGSIVIRSGNSVVTVTYQAYAATSGGATFCQFAGNAVRT